jgi:hypothetical protein
MLSHNRAPNTHLDPTRLPFWSTYVTEGKADTMKVGGTMDGECTGKCGSKQEKSVVLPLTLDWRRMFHSWHQWRTTQIATL